MGKCPICNMDLKEWNEVGTKSHLIVTKLHETGHIHVHGNIDNKDVMREMVDTATQEIGIVKSMGKLEKKEFIFHNRQRIGDILVFTCAIRDFKTAYPDTRVNVVSTAMHIWDHNPYIDSTLKQTTDNLIKIGPGKGTNQSNRIDWHFTNSYRISIEDALNIHIPQGESRPDIWLTQEEYDAPRIMEAPYWIIVVSGEKGWGCKMYPFERWQEFINQNPDVNFVQLGTKGDNPPRLQGANVTDYVGKTEDRQTGVRDLFKLFLNAEGSVGLVSFHMHLSGAFVGKPCIVVAGAREPVSFTQYAGHRYLSTDNCLPCGINACWHCDINTCTNLVGSTEKIPKCVDMISPEDLTRALNMYYTGGRLKKGIASEKPKFKNIVKTPPKPIVAEVAKPVTDAPKIVDKCSPRDLMRWGNGSIYEEDWKFLKEIMDKYSVKSVLEFGAGLSTIILNELGIKVVTYENDQDWIDATKKLNNRADIRKWDGQTIDCTDRFDLIFVDGPRAWGHMVFGRQHSIKIASELSDLVFLHDAIRPGEILWQNTYLKDNFDLIYEGGKWNYCHVWRKKDSPSIQPGSISCGNPITIDKINIAPSSKFIKMISTARGWGGCARSVTTIMKFLVDNGHRVELIPFRNKVSSREFLDFLKLYPAITVTENYDTLKENCDVLFVYADDYVWEFEKPEMVEAFSNLIASKKIMMLNYRRGKVGDLEWTKGWDKYMFLNSTQERELLKALPGVKTKVLPPCTELEEFLKIEPNYKDGVRIVRHSSQGDTKFDKETAEKEILSVLAGRPDVKIDMLPGPSFVLTDKEQRFTKHHRTGDPRVISEFLSKGNLFWYSLPVGYMDMGPRVILEAMAAGLPILADNWGGATDRVTPECGWLCDTKEQMLDIIKNVTPEELEAKGKAAKARAISEFIPERWVKEILE